MHALAIAPRRQRDLMARFQRLATRDNDCAPPSLEAAADARHDPHPPPVGPDDATGHGEPSSETECGATGAEDPDDPLPAPRTIDTGAYTIETSTQTTTELYVARAPEELVLLTTATPFQELL